MKVIIAGGRSYQFTQEDIDFLDEAKDLIPITEVVCGMAKGADECGRQWAIYNNIPVKEYPAEWDIYGRPAGMMRNKQMARYADALIVFPGGFGTQNMAKEAFSRGLEIYDRIN